MVRSLTIRKRITFWVVLFLLVQHFTRPTQAYACPYIFEDELSLTAFEKNFGAADAVFLGTVTKAHTNPEWREFVLNYMPSQVTRYLPSGFWVPTYHQKIEVDVLSSWKGVQRSQIRIYRDFTGADGIPQFLSGNEYLFYARHYTDTQHLMVLNCVMRTHEVSHETVQHDLKILQTYPTLPLVSNFMLSLFGATILIVFAVIGYLYSMMRKSRN